MEKNNFKADKDLVLACIDGNQQAITALVKKWHVPFCKLAFYCVKDKEVAKDIAQESWKVILDKLESLQEPEKFKSWATSLVKRKAIDYLRSDQRRVLKLQKLHAENRGETETEENREEAILNYKVILSRELKKLPENQKVVINLFYVEEYTLKEISDLLHISVGTAKSRLFHARERLKKIIKIYIV